MDADYEAHEHALAAARLATSGVSDSGSSASAALMGKLAAGRADDGDADEELLHECVQLHGSMDRFLRRLGQQALPPLPTDAQQDDLLHLAWLESLTESVAELCKLLPPPAATR